jgi:hypothetical protein
MFKEIGFGAFTAVKAGEIFSGHQRYHLGMHRGHCQRSYLSTSAESDDNV